MGWKNIVTAPWSMSWRTCDAPEEKWRLRGAVRTRVPSSSPASSSTGSRATRNSKSPKCRTSPSWMGASAIGSRFRKEPLRLPRSRTRNASPSE
jgi:hypothetical protein